MKKNRVERSAAMTAAGVITTNWSCLDRKVRELGGQQEDLYLLGSPEDTDTVALVNATAEKLVARGRASRAVSTKTQAQFPPPMAFQLKLMPKRLLVIFKDRSDAPTLISRMDGTFVSEFAKGMMSQMGFAIGPSEIAVVGVFDYGRLGVTSWPETDFFGPKGWEHVKQFGLAKCLQDDAPYVRMAHSEQALGEWIWVAHDPISSGGCSSVFFVGHRSDYGRCLGRYCLDSYCGLGADHLVALRVAS